MTYLWERHNKKTGERAYFLQFFDDDDMYPVDKSIATQILAAYKTWKLDPRGQDDAEKPNIATTLYEVDGDVPIIVQKIRAESDDEKYRIKFSKEGDYVNLDTDFIFMFQQACKMIPFDVENVKYGRIEYMAYQVVPKKVGCIKLE